MAENIKLKDLYNEEQSFTDISTIAVPKTDGSGDTYYVQRPIINYTLQDPPTHELTDADAGVFAWNAGDGTVLVGDVGNFLGSVEASAAGKTTRPIVTITVTKHLSGATINANGAALLVYLYEELSGTVLLDVLGETGNTGFTAQAGWGQLLLADTSPLEITGYAKINDPGAVIIGIEQPVGYQKADVFYSLLSEVTQEAQTVSVTENGEQTIVPTAGKSGIRKVALNVNVPSSGGNLQEKSVTITSNGTTEVEPDAGYDGMRKLTAVVNVEGGGGNDYYLLKNPLGEMPTYEGGVFQALGKPPRDPKPFVTVIGGLNANSALGYKNTEVFSYKKENRPEATSLIYFWYAEDAETIPAALMQQYAGSWPYGDVTLAKGWNITTFSVNGDETTASTTAATLDAVNMELAAYGGIPKDNFDWAEMDAYTLSFFKDAASKEQANWNQNDSTAADYVKNRPGAYYETIPAKTYTFDGNLTGKTYDANSNVVFVSSDVITKDALSSATYTRVVNGESTTASVTDVQDTGGAFIFEDMSTGALYVVVIPTDEASATLGLAKGIWFGCNADATAYTSTLTTPVSSIPVELPQELTEVKQADWGENSGIRSIQNRIGGYYNANLIDVTKITITFDGSFEGKTTLQIDDTRTMVKVLDYPLTMMQLASAENIIIYMNNADVSEGNLIKLPRWCEHNEADLLCWMMVLIINVQGDTKTEAGALASVYAKSVVPIGTYLIINTNSDGSLKQPYIKSIDVEVPSCDMLYGWYIYPDFNGKPISGDALILQSSTHNSAKKFKITVDDTGTLTATEVTN